MNTLIQTLEQSSQIIDIYFWGTGGWGGDGIRYIFSPGLSLVMYLDVSLDY